MKNEIEALFVGFYILLIYLILQFIIQPPMFLFFVVGFIKHFLGYVLGLHELYCRIKSNKISTSRHLVIDSLIEGIVVMCLMIVLTPFIYAPIAIFAVGIFLHVISEILGIHAYFLENRCSSV